MSRHAAPARRRVSDAADGPLRVSDLVARYQSSAPTPVEPPACDTITEPLPLLLDEPALPVPGEPVPPISVSDLLERYGRCDAAVSSHRAARTSRRPEVHLPVRPTLAAAAVLVTAAAGVEAPALFSHSAPAATAAGDRGAAVTTPSSPTSAASSSTAAPSTSASSGREQADPARPTSTPTARVTPTRVSRNTRRTVVPAPHLKPGQTVPGIWVRPNDGPYNSCFCMRWGVMHWGVDMAGQLGSPILAVGDGTVLEAGPADGFGNWVVLQHANGDVSIYGHMQYYFVHPGEKVKAGQRIALVGQEGQATGPHLHFEVHQGGLNGPKIDPIPWLKARGIDLGTYNPNG